MTTRPRARRSRRAATLSSASGGFVIAPSRTAWRKLATASSLSLACHRPSGAAQGPRTRSTVCTRSSSDGSKPRPCYRRPILLRCCSGRCSPQGRSTCGKSRRLADARHKVAGRLRSPQRPRAARCRCMKSLSAEPHQRDRRCEDRPSAHQKIANAAKVERAERFPFRHQNERMRPLRAAIRVLGECNVVQKRAGESHSRRIIGAHVRPGILQAADDRKICARAASCPAGGRRCLPS